MENTVMHRGITIHIKQTYTGFSWSFDYNHHGFECRRTYEQETYADALEQAKSEVDELFDLQIAKALN